MKTLSIVLCAALLSTLPRIASADDCTTIAAAPCVPRVEQSRAPMALALVITGSVLAVGGIAVFGGSLAMRPDDQAAIDVQLGLFVAGPTFTAAGIGLLVPGIILLATGARPFDAPRKAGLTWTLAGPKLVF